MVVGLGFPGGVDAGGGSQEWDKGSKTTILSKITRFWELWPNLLKTQAVFEKYFNFEIRCSEDQGAGGWASVFQPSDPVERWGWERCLLPSRN
jgi:hypothetical protein